MNTQSGRSMVEMLGVLAIIGVLSVGAISGYSKAMFKYKLNKHAEQMNTLVNAVARNVHNFDNLNSETYLTETFIKMGEIPTEMIKSNDNDYVYDIFGQGWQILYSEHSIYLLIYHEGGLSFLSSNSSDSLAICQNILTVAKENSGNVTTILTETANSESYIFGDSFCDRARNMGYQCLKDLTLDNVYTICTEQLKSDMVLFGFDWER